MLLSLLLRTLPITWILLIVVTCPQQGRAAGKVGSGTPSLGAGSGCLTGVLENAGIAHFFDDAEYVEAIKKITLRKTLDQHLEGVRFVAYSPDGSKIVSASYDNTIKIWDVETGQELANLPGHSSLVISVAFSPDGTQILSAYSDNMIKLWEAATGKELGKLPGHTGSVSFPVYSPDGSKILIAPFNNTIKGGAKTGKELANLPGYTGSIRFAGFSPDVSKMVSGSFDKTIIISDAATGKVLASLQGHIDEVISAAFSPDGSKIVSASKDKTIKIWDVATGKELATLEGHTDGVVSAAFSPDGTKIVSASSDKMIKIWDVGTGKELASLEGHKNEVWSAVFSPDGTQIVSGSRDNTVKIWDIPVKARSVVKRPPQLESPAIDPAEYVKAIKKITLGKTLEGHSGEVWFAVYSPDRSKIVSASRDKTIKIWDAKTGKELATLEGHSNTVYSVAFSPDGTQIVSASSDKMIKIWDAKTGKELATLEGHLNKVYSAAFSPDGSKIVSASIDKTIKIWDAKTGKELATLEGHSVTAMFAVFSPDGSKIVSGSADKTIKIWDAKTGKELATLKGHSDIAYTVAFSPDGSKIVSASKDKVLKIWNVETGKEQATLKGHADQVLFAAFSPDGSKIVSGSLDKTIKIWDVETGKELATLEGHSNTVMSAVFSPDGTQIVSASSDKTIKIWDIPVKARYVVKKPPQLESLAIDPAEYVKAIKKITLRKTLEGHSDDVWSADYSPDRSKVVSSSVDKTIKIWDAKTGKELATLEGHSGGVYNVAFSPDGTKIVSGSGDGTIKIWDVETGKELATLKGHSDSVYTVSISLDGSKIVTASRDKTIKIWDVETGKELSTLTGDSYWFSATFSPDGTKIVSASYDKTIKIWDVETGKGLAILKGHSDRVNAVAISPDGSKIVSASKDKMIKIWDVATGKELATLKGHSDSVFTVDFSPDGSKIVSASNDKTIKIWDVETGKELATLKGHSHWVRSAVFSPDGTQIVSGSRDNTVKIWDIPVKARSVVKRPPQLESPAIDPAEYVKAIKKITLGKTLDKHSNSVRGVAYSPDGSKIVSASYDKTIKIWDAKTSQELANLPGHTKWVNSAAFSPDGSKIVSASNDSTIKVWEAATGKELATLSGHADGVRFAAFSPDGSKIVSVSASFDKAIKIWDAKTGKELASLQGHSSWIWSAAFSPDGSKIVSASNDKTIKIWDAKTGKELATLEGHANGVWSAAFSPDGSKIVSASNDKTIKIWDAKTGKELATLSGHTRSVNSAAFNRDGSKVVSTSHDKTIKIWDVTSGKELVTLSGHAEQVWSAVFSPDGTQIVSASSDKTIKIWDIPIPAQVIPISAQVKLELAAAPKKSKAKLNSADDVRATAKSSDPDAGSLKTLVELADSRRSALLESVQVDAQQSWKADPTQYFKTVLRQKLKAALTQFDIEKEVKKVKATKQSTRSKHALTLLYKELVVEDSHVLWLADKKPDLAFGEELIVPKSEQILEITPIKKPVIDQLVKLGEIGSNVDKRLLEQMLSTVDEGLLKELQKAGYTIFVSRNNITHAATDLRGQSFGSSGYAVDFAEGVHQITPEKGHYIVARSYMKDGVLVMDMATVMHGIGHAVDLVLKAKGADKDPLHVEKNFAEAFTQEHQKLPPYFHNQKEFIAEVFARYSLDKERTQREFPLAAAAFEKTGLPKTIVDGKALNQLYQTMIAAAPVSAQPDPLGVLGQFEAIRNARRQQKKPSEPYIIELNGEAGATQALARQLGPQLTRMRAPQVGPFRLDEGFAHLNPTTFNSSTEFKKFLGGIASSHGKLIYMDDFSGITDSSPGFKILKEFNERMGDLAPLVLAGRSTERKAFMNQMPTTLRRQITIDPLAKNQVAELVRRVASNEGYELTQEALRELEVSKSASSFDSAIRFWAGAKQQQLRRSIDLAGEIKRQPEAVSYVLARDVLKAGLGSAKDPLQLIMDMVGLDAVKAKIHKIMGSVLLAKREEELGLEQSNPPRLNLLFSGNPGTGKTKVATLLAQGLFRSGFLKSDAVARVKVQDILAGNPEQNVKELFERNKDGVIFIDEFHQLADTPEGRRAFRAMIPYLAEPEYRRTVFIGAGYAEELGTMLREIDPGAERRFTSLPFPDYTASQIPQIVKIMLAERHLKASDEVKKSLAERVLRKQRAMKNPGNAGDVETVIESSHDNQKERLAKLQVDGKNISREQIATLEEGDVVLGSAHTVESVWKEIDAVKGLETTKEHLRAIQDLMDYNKATGEDVLTGVEPYFILEGPSGSGKTMMAGLIGKLFAANGVIPDDTLVTAKSGDLQGGYLGNSTTLAIRKLFESAWGKTLFIDEIGAIASIKGGYEEQAIKEMLTQMEGNRGKFVLVVADYPNKINNFLALDAGLPRRFGGNRVTLTAMSARDATDQLHDLLGKMNLEARELDHSIEKRLKVIANLPGWASGGDVRTLANKVKTFHAAEMMKLIRAKKQEGVDVKKVLPEVMKKALDLIETEIRKRPDPNQDESKTTGNLSFDKQRKTESKSEERIQMSANLSDVEKQQFDAMAIVDKKFGDQFNKDPEELTRQENDAQSAYNQALAEELGVTPEAAQQVRVRMKVKVKKMVEVMTVSERQRFEYHCPYCDRVESKSCHYINYPLEWKIAHSLKKPWSEKVKTKQKKEIENEEIQEHKVDL